MSTSCCYAGPTGTDRKISSIVPVSEQGVYSIGALARMLGVSPTTLRSWEDRYAVVVPERSAGSQRLYSREHLDQLQFVCRQMESGLSAADAHRVLAERLASNPRFTMADRGEPAERTVVLVERDPYAAELAEYLLRTEGYDVHLVRTGADAERVVAAKNVDLAIVDLMIDRGAGLQLCEELSRTISRTRGVGARPAGPRACGRGTSVHSQAARSAGVGFRRARSHRDERDGSRLETRTAGMMERITSGNERLDALLGGGLPANGINLIIGHPGTGKTILAEQYLFHNARLDRPGIYLSTVSEPFDKMLRYGQSLTFFDTDAIGTSIFYDDLGEVVTHDGLPGVVNQIDVILKEQQPRFVVIDSFKALRSFAVDEADFRRFLHDLAGRLDRCRRLHILDRRVRPRSGSGRARVRRCRRDHRVACQPHRRARTPRAASAETSGQRLSDRRARVPHRLPTASPSFLASLTNTTRRATRSARNGSRRGSRRSTKRSVMATGPAQ